MESKEKQMKSNLGFLLRVVLTVWLRIALTVIIVTSGMFFIHKLLPTDLALSLNDIWSELTLMANAIAIGIMEEIVTLFYSDKGN